MAITSLLDASLRPYNTFGLDVNASRLIVYDRPDADLPALFAGELAEGAPFIHVGHGSNLLFTGDYAGTVLSAATYGIEAMPRGNGVVFVRCEAGLAFDDFVSRTAAAGLYGAENLSLIPGTVGASAVQNIGAYGSEVADIITAVEVFDTETRRPEFLTNADCQYGYRSSALKSAAGRYIVTAVMFRLSKTKGPNLEYSALRHLAERPGAVPSPMDVRNEVIAVRRAKLPEPEQTGSAGSYFKNPVLTHEAFAALKQRVSLLQPSGDLPPVYPAGEMVKTSAAWLIDRSGLKGCRLGHAGTWHLQPLVLINADGHATAADILALEHHIVSTVESRFGVRLEPEVQKV